MAWYALRLEALRYPRASAFKPDALQDLSQLVLWLERTWLRALSEPDAVQLARHLDTTDSARWLTALHEYAQRQGCTRSKDVTEVMEWLLSSAAATQEIALEEHLLLDENTLRQAGVEPAAAPAGGEYDYDSDEFKGAVNALAKALGVPPSGEDHKATLLVCLTLLEGRLPLSGGGAAAPLSPADLPVGFDTGDKALNNAAAALRLLFISDLRELQTAINHLIASRTASSQGKMDTTKGRVGK
jgi:hypothetical protein